MKYFTYHEMRYIIENCNTQVTPGMQVTYRTVLQERKKWHDHIGNHQSYRICTRLAGKDFIRT